jgi:hypothetical protein
MRAMADDAFYSPKYQPPERVPKPGELLFEFVRALDHAPMSCELRFHGETRPGMLLGRAIEMLSRCIGAQISRACAINLRTR